MATLAPVGAGSRSSYIQIAVWFRAAFSFLMDRISLRLAWTDVNGKSARTKNTMIKFEKVILDAVGAGWDKQLAFTRDLDPLSIAARSGTYRFERLINR